MPKNRPQFSFLNKTPSYAAAAVLAVSICGIGTATAATKIIAGTVFLSSTVWAEFVADAKGYFKERDLDVEIIATRSSSKAVQQLTAGSIHVGSSGIPDYLRAIDQGAPIKIFKNQIGTPPYTIFAKAGIKSIADLKGKRVPTGYASQRVIDVLTKGALANGNLATPTFSRYRYRTWSAAQRSSRRARPTCSCSRSAPARSRK